MKSEIDLVQARVLVPPIFIEHEPHIPSRHERRKVNVESISFFIYFSADAADEKLYSKLRVNCQLNKVLKNIERFQKIRETQYQKNLIISRVSGVKFSDEQDFDSMKNLWSGLVDQVAFVDYTPWENVYESKKNQIKRVWFS